MAFVFTGVSAGGSWGAGVIVVARHAPQLLLLVIGGAVGDRWPRRRVAVCANISATLSQGACAVLLLSGRATLASLSGLAALNGAAYAFFSPASAGMLPAIVPSANIQDAASRLRVLTTSARILGLMAGGELVALGGNGVAMAIDSTTYLAGALLLGMLRGTMATDRSDSTSLGRNVVAGWSVFRSVRWLMRLLVVFALMDSAGIAVMSVLGPLAAVQHYGGAGVWGVIAGCQGIGSVAGSALATRVKPARPLIAVMVALGSDVPLALTMAIRAPVLMVYGSAVVAGLGAGLAYVLFESTLQRKSPERWISSLMAYGDVVPFGAIIAAQLASGPLAAGLGTEAALFLFAGLSISGLLFGLCSPTLWLRDRLLVITDGTENGDGHEHKNGLAIAEQP